MLYVLYLYLQLHFTRLQHFKYSYVTYFVNFFRLTHASHSFQKMNFIMSNLRNQL